MEMLLSPPQVASRKRRLLTIPAAMVSMPMNHGAGTAPVACTVVGHATCDGC
jgi:hypothetical protein